MNRKEFIQSLVDENVMPVAVITSTPFKTYYNKRNYVAAGDYENSTQPSMTVPDQSMSVAELVYRYTHGQPLGGQRIPVYDEDMEIQFPADWDKLDISEKHDFFNAKAVELQELQESLRTRQGELLRKQKEEELERAVNDKLKAIREMRKGTYTEQELPLDEKPK